MSTVKEEAAQLVERLSDHATFSLRWRGKFEPACRDDDRYKALAKKYL